MRPKNNRPSRPRFALGVLMPILLVLAATSGLLALVLNWTARGADDAALTKQNLLVEQAMRRGVDSISHQQESVTVWDDAILRLRSGDLEWLDGNLGVWLFDYFGIDRVFILDAAGKPVYGMMGGQRVDPGAYSSHASLLDPLVTELRLASQDGETTARRRLVVLENRPAVIGASLVVTDSGRIVQRPEDSYLHLAVRFLDTSFMSTMSEEALVDDLHFSWTGTHGRGQGRRPITDADGRTIGWYVWTADRPGEALLGRISTVLAAAGAALLLLVWVMARRLYRISSELEASEAAAHHVAFHDTLTGLPNRALFNHRLEQVLVKVRAGGSAALLFMDLDRFKDVNDTFGHQAGDELIREFGERLSAIVRGRDTVARLGGDEFAVLLTDGGAAAATMAATEILRAVSKPFAVLGNEAFVGASIGIALAPEAGTDASELVRKADIALYRAKEEGRNGFRIFTGGMDESVQRRREIERDLRIAIETGDQLTLQYQPLWSADGETIVGVEALVRWMHPLHGLLSPGAFVPIAEETGLIGPLGEWVLREACRAGRSMGDLTMAVNVSAVQMRTATFPDLVASVLRETGMPPERLELEITESVLMDDRTRASATIAALHAIGVRIALDDFGTGYSSLSYLRNFAVDKIKIDRSFVKALADDTNSSSIVQAIVDLGCAMGMQVTAEGVETHDQHRLVTAAGCHQVQGYLFSRPLSLGEIVQLRRERHVSTEVARPAKGAA